MKWLLAALLSTTLACASTGTLQQTTYTADSTAYTALSAFQQVEEAAWHTQPALPWPTPAQHQAIGAALVSAYGYVVDIAQADLALQPGQTLAANISSELTALAAIAGTLVAQTPAATASKQAVSASRTANQRLNALVTNIAAKTAVRK